MSNNSMNEPVNWYNPDQPGYPSGALSPKSYENRNQWARSSQYNSGAVNYAPRAEVLDDGDNVDSQDTMHYGDRSSSLRPNNVDARGSHQPNNAMVNSMNEPVNWYNSNQEPYPAAQSSGNYNSYNKSQ